MWKEITCLLLFATLLLTLSLTSARQKSATFDEGLHIPAAYTYAAYGDFRLNPEHPPLVKLLSGLPLLGLQPRVDLNDPDWRDVGELLFGWKFLYLWNDADRLIFWARVPVVLLSLLIGLGVWWCARDLFGWKAGCLALILYLFNPDLLAHGQLVTTDLAVAGFLFLAVYTFFRSLRRLSVGKVLLVCLAVGAALLSKFSGVLVFPMLALVGAAFAFSRTPVEVALPKLGERSLTSWQSKLVAAAALVLVTVLTSVVLIWACYGFRYQLSSDAEVARTVSRLPYAASFGPVNSIVEQVHLWQLLPQGYTYGFVTALESTRQRVAFLHGEHSTRGWWYYFLVTFLIKTTLPFLALIALAGCLIRRYRAKWEVEAILLLPMIFYWLVALTSNINIGHRHLLPTYPFLIVFVSRLANVFSAAQPRVLAVVCALLIAWNVGEVLWVYPHFLSYFNQIAGGPAGGYRWLVDSNLDWGQDLKGLAKYVKEHPTEPIYISYFGSANSGYYGLRAKWLPGYNPETKIRQDIVPFGQVPSGAIVAVSATSLQGSYLSDRAFPGIEQFMARLRKLEPVAKIGYSILIYRIP
jgi:hypothetical protein